MNKKTVHTPNLRLQANIKPSTVNLEARTVDAVVTSEYPVRRQPWFDEPFDEILDISSKSINLERANNLQILDSHDYTKLENTLGICDRLWIDETEKKLYATLRFSQTDRVNSIWQDVQDGILKNISVGYKVDEYTEEKRKTNSNVRVLRATRWTPLEVSIVNIPADPTAQIRQENNVNQTVIINKQPEQEGVSMPESVKSQDNQAVNQQENINHVENYKLRTKEILKLCTIHNMNDRASEFIDKDLSLEDVKSIILDTLSKTNVIKETANDISITSDSRDKTIDNLKRSVLHRIDPSNKLDDGCSQYRGMSLIETAKVILNDHGVNTKGLTPNEVSQKAFSTNEFSALLAGVSEQRLRVGFESQPKTYESFVNETNTLSFKDIETITLSDIGQMPKVVDDDFKIVSMSDKGQRYKIERYGEIINISRVHIVNDDLSVISKIPFAIGVSAQVSILNAIYGILTSNPEITVIEGGKEVAIKLFSTKNGNDISGNIDEVTLSAIETFFESITSKNGTPLRLPLKNLIVPSTHKVTAKKLIQPIYATSTESSNLFTDLNVISDPLINNQNVFFGTTDKTRTDIIEIAYLDGKKEPYIEYRDPFTSDGMQMKGRIDFGVSPVDFRGLIRVTMPTRTTPRS